MTFNLFALNYFTPTYRISNPVGFPVSPNPARGQAASRRGAPVPCASPPSSPGAFCGRGAVQPQAPKCPLALLFCLTPEMPSPQRINSFRSVPAAVIQQILLLHLLFTRHRYLLPAPLVFFFLNTQNTADGSFLPCC